MKIDTVEKTVEFRIENIPIHRPRMDREKFPFGKMRVGQSFFFESGDVDVTLVRQAACHYGKRNNVKFSILREANGFRCGRVK